MPTSDSTDRALPTRRPLADKRHFRWFTAVTAHSALRQALNAANSWGRSLDSRTGWYLVILNSTGVCPSHERCKTITSGNKCNIALPKEGLLIIQHRLRSFPLGISERRHALSFRQGPTSLNWYNWSELSSGISNKLFIFLTQYHF